MPPLFSLNQKNVVITGGSGLLGQAIAQLCHQLEANVVVIDHTPENPEEPFPYYQADISDRDAMIACMDHIHIKHGVIHGWVNCAYPRTEDWGVKCEVISSDSWAKNVDLQLNSICDISRHYCQYLKERGEGGSLVNLGSIYGTLAPDFEIYKNTEMTMPAAYAAIKGGIINFSKYLASYYGEHNIRVNCVSPGGTYNEQDPAFVEAYNKRTMLKRMATPMEVAHAVVFLLSPASSYMTAQNLLVDGGLSSM